MKVDHILLRFPGGSYNRSFDPLARLLLAHDLLDRPDVRRFRASHQRDPDHGADVADVALVTVGIFLVILRFSGVSQFNGDFADL